MNDNKLRWWREARKWGKVVLTGEGGLMSPDFAPSPDMIHDQKTLFGSWVANIWRMEELVERIVRWNIHPADLRSPTAFRSTKH
jgi:threonine dehydrogenase-like Zn-dependent dehydrogenase